MRLPVSSSRSSWGRLSITTIDESFYKNIAKEFDEENSSVEVVRNIKSHHLPRHRSALSPNWIRNTTIAPQTLPASTKSKTLSPFMSLMERSISLSPSNDDRDSTECMNDSSLSVTLYPATMDREESSDVSKVNNAPSEKGTRTTRVTNRTETGVGQQKGLPTNEIKINKKGKKHRCTFIISEVRRWCKHFISRVRVSLG